MNALGRRPDLGFRQAVEGVLSTGVLFSHGASLCVEPSDGL